VHSGTGRTVDEYHASTTAPADQAERIEHYLAGWQHFLPRLAALA
jgi:hypothetical protein